MCPNSLVGAYSFFLLWWKSEEEGPREVIFEAFFCGERRKKQLFLWEKTKKYVLLQSYSRGHLEHPY